MQAHQYIGLNAPAAPLVEVDSPAYFSMLEKSGLPEDLFLFRGHLVALGQPKREVKAIIHTLKGYFDKGFEFTEIIMFEDHWGRLNIQPNRFTQGLAIPLSESRPGLGKISLGNILKDVGKSAAEDAAQNSQHDEIGGSGGGGKKNPLKSIDVISGTRKLFDNIFGSKQHRADQRINGTPTILDWIIGKSGMKGAVNTQNLTEWSRLFHLWLSEQERVTDRHYSAKRREGAEAVVAAAKEYKDNFLKGLQESGFTIKQTGTKSLNGNSVTFPLGPNEGGSKISYPSDNSHGHASQKTTSYPVYSVSGSGSRPKVEAVIPTETGSTNVTGDSKAKEVTLNPKAPTGGSNGFTTTGISDRLMEAGINPWVPVGIIGAFLVISLMSNKKG